MKNYHLFIVFFLTISLLLMVLFSTIFLLPIEYINLLRGNCNNSIEACQMLINNKGDSKMPKRLKSIKIIQSGKTKCDIAFFATNTNITFFDEKNIARYATYDVVGNKISECTIWNGMPIEGTIWFLTLGAKGVKNSELMIFKYGFPISHKPYKIEQIDELLNSISRIWLSDSLDIKRNHVVDE